MKVAMIKAASVGVSIVSWLLIGLSAVGALSLAFPEFTAFVTDFLGIQDTALVSFVLGGAGVGTLGVVGKSLKNSFNTQNALLVARHNAELSLWKKEKEELQLEVNDFMLEFTEKNLETHKVLAETDNKIDLTLLFQVAYAEERLNMSDTLVPPNVKERYKAFLDKVNQGEATATMTIADIDPITLTETVETTVEVPITKKEKRQQEKAEAREIKAQQGVGLR